VWHGFPIAARQVSDVPDGGTPTRADSVAVAPGRSPIHFDVRRVDANPRSACEIVPVVDGRDLVELVADHEQASGFDPAGGYGGFVPSLAGRGPVDLVRYYLGEDPVVGRSIDVLGCQCGELGCWPLVVEVVVTGSEVTWHSFRQPHRPGWSYSGFGPFRFERGTYERAAEDAQARVAPRGPT
jgi:hypothetical protein